MTNPQSERVENSFLCGMRKKATAETSGAPRRALSAPEVWEQLRNKGVAAIISERVQLLRGREQTPDWPIYRDIGESVALLSELEIVVAGG